MTFAEAADKYIRWAGTKRRGLRTLIPYEIKAFGVFVHNAKIESVSIDDVAEYVRVMLEIGWHPNTAHRKAAHLRNFFRYLQLSGLRVLDHRAIPSPERIFSEPDILTEQQYRKILKAIPAQTPYGIRDLAQISMLHDTGVRLGELMSLNIDNVDVRTRHVTEKGVVLWRGVVRTEKVRSQPQLRQIFWLTATNRRLTDWLRTREALIRRRGRRRDGIKALWISTDSANFGRRPHDNTLGNHLRGYARRAGITQRIHPHMFRHAFARSRVLGGAETSAIASLLGHSNIESSLIYTRLYGKHLRDAYARYLPDPETEEDGRTAKSLRRLMAKN